MTTDTRTTGRAAFLLVLAALAACGERTGQAHGNDVPATPADRPHETALPGWTAFELPIAGSRTVSLVPVATYGAEDIPGRRPPQPAGRNVEQAVLSDHVDMVDTEAGELIVLDNRRAEIIVFSADGQVLDLLRGGFGEGPGEFRRTRSITVCRDGSIDVLDAGLNRVSMFRRGSGFVRAFRPEVALPYTLVCTDTTLWVHGRLKEGGEAVWRLDSIGRAVEGAIAVDARDAHIASFGEPGVFGPLPNEAMAFAHPELSRVSLIQGHGVTTFGDPMFPEAKGLVVNGARLFQMAPRGIGALEDSLLALAWMVVPGEVRTLEDLRKMELRLDILDRQGLHLASIPLVQDGKYPGRVRFSRFGHGIYMFWLEPYPQIVRYVVE